MRGALPGPVGVLAVGLLAIILIAASGKTEAVDDLPIEAFFGTYEGTGLARSDESDYFGLTVRDLDVTVSAAAGGGMTVSWTTVIRQGGDPNNPDIRRKSASLVFAPTGRPNIFRAQSAADPISGGSYAWAFVKGQTLTVNSLSVNEDGDYVMQTYNRTLSGLGMELEFISVRGGDTLRRVEGRLTKRAN